VSAGTIRLSCGDKDRVVVAMLFAVTKPPK
jgi:hypothetical protein